MRWSASGRSQNLEDRRGGGGGGMIPGGIGGLGIGGVVLVVIFSLITKQNPLAVIGALDGGTAAPGVEAPITCLLYTSPSPRDRTRSRMPSSA